MSASWALTECSTFSSVGPSFVKEGCISFAMAPTESEIQFHSSCFRWLQARSLKLRRDSESEPPGWPEATYKIPWEMIINFSLKPLLSEWFVLLSYITGTSACAKLHFLYCPYIMNHRWNQRAYASSSTCLRFWNFWYLCILLSFIYLYLDLSPDSELISQNIKTQEKLDSFVVCLFCNMLHLPGLTWEVWNQEALVRGKEIVPKSVLSGPLILFWPLWPSESDFMSLGIMCLPFSPKVLLYVFLYVIILRCAGLQFLL